MRSVFALCFLLGILVLCYCKPKSSSKCDRSLGLDSYGREPEELDQTFRCRSGSLRWNYPHQSLNVTFQPMRPKWGCVRVCFNVTFPGAEMRDRNTGDVVFNETFTTSVRYGSRDLPVEPRCVQSNDVLPVSIHGNPSVNAYVWVTSFTTDRCRECVRCTADTLTDTYLNSSFVARVTANSVVKSSDRLDVSFQLKKFIVRQKGKGNGLIATINSVLKAGHVSVDSCNAMLTGGKDYGLLYTPSRDMEYTFCSIRAVRQVKRALKNQKSGLRTRPPSQKVAISD